MTEKEKKTYTSPYPIPGLTADVAVFVKKSNDWDVLLIKRGGEPFMGYWALPGGFANPGESLCQTALRELEEETKIKLSETVNFTYVNEFSTPGRDPRGWTVSHLFMYSHNDWRYPYVKASDDAVDHKWASVDTIRKGGILLAFDHKEMILEAAAKLTK